MFSPAPSTVTTHISGRSSACFATLPTYMDLTRQAADSVMKSWPSVSFSLLTYLLAACVIGSRNLLWRIPWILPPKGSTNFSCLWLTAMQAPMHEKAFNLAKSQQTLMRSVLSSFNTSEIEKAK